jgi:hypothetical protein
VSSGSTERLPEQWLSTLWLPESENGGLPENIRGVCLQQLVGAWSCLVNIEGYGFDLPVSRSATRGLCFETDVQPFVDLMPSVAKPHSDWMHPIRLATSLPWSTCAPALAFFARRHSHIPMTAPHWPHIFSIAMQSLLAVSTSATSPQSTSPPVTAPKPPSAVWSATQKWFAAYLTRTNMGGDPSKTACRLITDVVSWADEAIEIRQEDRGAWYKGKEWQDLAGLWIDLARKVSHSSWTRLTFRPATVKLWIVR